jgi:hypothetical protein
MDNTTSPHPRITSTSQHRLVTDTDPQHDNPDNPDNPTGALVWSTATSGPGRQIIDEWARLTRRPATLRAVNSWEFLPRPARDLDDLLTMCGFGTAVDDTDGDRVLWNVVRHAEHDELAARVVLQRIMPSLLAIARKRGRMSAGGLNGALTDAITTAWIVIREFPHERRLHKIAANLVRDTEYYAFVREGRLKRVQEAQIGDDHLLRMAEPEVFVAAERELEDVLVQASEMGVNNEYIEILNSLGSGVHGNELAVELGVSPRTVRNHRRRAIDAVRDVMVVKN